MKVKYKNWSINKKLLSISLSAFLPMVILAAYLIVSLNNAASAYSEITKSIAYANRYVKDFKSRLDYSVYLAVVSNKQLKEVGDGVKMCIRDRKVTVYEEVEKTIKKDNPSRLHARRQMLKVLYPVTEVPTAAAGKKKNTKEVDLVDKLFTEIAPKYADRNGGYTRIIKIGQRKGDAAMEVILELV